MIDSQAPFDAPRSADPLCIHGWIEARVNQCPDSVAITAPGRVALTYRRLWQQIEETVAVLNGAGIGRNDRVALLLPNGPEMAVAFVAVAAGATCAPLNPAYRSSEFDYYLTDLEVRTLIVQ